MQVIHGRWQRRLLDERPAPSCKQCVARALLSAIINPPSGTHLSSCLSASAHTRCNGRYLIAAPPRRTAQLTISCSIPKDTTGQDRVQLVAGDLRRRLLTPAHQRAMTSLTRLQAALVLLLLPLFGLEALVHRRRSEAEFATAARHGGTAFNTIRFTLSLTHTQRHARTHTPRPVVRLI